MCDSRIFLGNQLKEIFHLMLNMATNLSVKNWGNIVYGLGICGDSLVCRIWILIATSACFAAKKQFCSSAHVTVVVSDRNEIKIALIKDDETDRVVDAYDPATVSHYPVRRLSFCANRDYTDYFFFKSSADQYVR